MNNNICCVLAGIALFGMGAVCEYYMGTGLGWSCLAMLLVYEKMSFV